MYYLTITNLGEERCIHSSEEGLYMDGMSFSCTPSLEFPGGTLIREISIRCPEVPETSLRARVYKND